MASLNKVLLIGNLTRDPELRYTSGGAAMVSFSLATNRKWNDASGAAKEEVTFVKVIVWGKSAENCGKLSKGSPVFVEGRLRMNEWEKDGVKRSSLEVVAQTVQFLGGKPGGGGRTDSDHRDHGPEGDDEIPF